MVEQARAGLKLRVEGASPSELMLGLGAAWEVFDRAGTTPFAAVEAIRDLAGWDMRDFATDDLPPPRMAELADVWAAAQLAAVRACCQGWGSSPQDAALSLVEA